MMQLKEKNKKNPQQIPTQYKERNNKSIQTHT
jgi:hypothetical protein